mmetsp:Transcript_52251/g.118907  ORF Transcript_52251/g.118907 Transcript_52251/m.118907 type:complete len:469 (-) Transcript_52251:58-1464(-)
MSRVEEFITSNQLDDKCAEVLRALDQGSQDAVIDMQPAGFYIQNVDPAKGSASSVVMGRLRRLKKSGGKPRHGAPQQPVPAGHWAPPAPQAMPHMGLQGGKGNRAYPRPRQQVPQYSAPVMAGGDSGSGQYAPPEFIGNAPKRLEEFIAANELDEKCATRLRQLSAVEASWVVDQGFIIEGVDVAKGTASAMAMSRLKKLQNMTPYERERYPSVENISKRVEDFIRHNGLDDQVRATLSSLGPVLAAQVVDRGFVIGGVDESKGSASAVAMARVKRARQTQRQHAGPPTMVYQPPAARQPAMRQPPPPQHYPIPQQSQSGPPAKRRRPSRLEYFQQLNGLDQKCMDTLHKLSPTQQDMIMDIGFVVEGVNAQKGSTSSCVMGRLKKIKDFMAADPTLESQYPTDDALNKRVEQYLAVNGADESCAQAVRSMAPHAVIALMESAFIVEGVDPNRGSASSIIMARSRKYR